MTTIEHIKWVDAETRDAWREHKEAVRDMTEDSMEAEAVGWVIAETEDRVILTGMRNTSMYALSIGIPRVAITERIVLVTLDTKKLKVI